MLNFVCFTTIFNFVCFTAMLSWVEYRKEKNLQFFKAKTVRPTMELSENPNLIKSNKKALWLEMDLYCSWPFVSTKLMNSHLQGLM